MCSPCEHLMDGMHQTAREKKGKGDGAGDMRCHQHHLPIWIHFHATPLCTTTLRQCNFPVGMLVLPVSGDKPDQYTLAIIA